MDLLGDPERIPRLRFEMAQDLCDVMKYKKRKKEKEHGVYFRV